MSATAELLAWLNGTATGGPEGDGRYPLTGSNGVVSYVLCPAAQELNPTIDPSPIDAYVASAAADAAIAHAEAVKANAWANTVENTAVEPGLFSARHWAAKAATYAAGTTADLTGYYTKTISDGRFRLQSTAITYSELSGKPSTFTPSAHSHVIGDVTGLQTALDAKAAATSVYTRTEVDGGLSRKLGTINNAPGSYNASEGTSADNGVNETGFNYGTGSAPTWGPILTFGGHFGGSLYRGQVMMGYGASEFHFRSRNGDSNTWNPWRTTWHNGNFDPATKLGVSAKAADSELIDGVDSSRLVYGQNGSGTTGVQDMNTPTKSGFYESSSGVNGPVSGWNWYLHHEHTNNGYGFTMSNILGTNDFYLRYKSGGGFGAWNKIHHSGSTTIAPAGTGGAYFSGNGSGTQHNGTFYSAGAIYKLSADSSEWLYDYRHKPMTTAAYAALATKDPNTIYLVY